MDIHELLELIVKYEEDTISEKDEIRLFQYLVDSNDYLNLQGHYGRHAEELIKQGLVHYKGESNDKIEKDDK